MPLKAILFDKDGTLLDFDLTWGAAGYHVMKTIARGDEKGFERLVEVTHYDLETRRYRPTSEMVAGSLDEIGPLWAKALGRDDHSAVADEINTLFMASAPDYIVPLDDPAAILSGLAKEGYQLGIATNDSEAAALQQAEIMGLIPHLDFIVGHDSGHGRKPDPGMVEAFARHTGLSPQEIALVGDSTHDLHAARKAGAVAIAVLSGPASRDDLEPHADYVINSIADLPGLVAGL
jgi:phosphoglycolate phosphatase